MALLPFWYGTVLEKKKWVHASSGAARKFREQEKAGTAFCEAMMMSR